MVVTLPTSIRRFKDDDRGFLAWLRINPDGYFINSERNPRPNYLILHRPGCSHFTGNPALRWTRSYIKFCSANRAELEEWAIGTVGGEATLCPTCMG